MSSKAGTRKRKNVKTKSGNQPGGYNFEDEANNPPPVPFDDALRRILKAKPQPKPTKKPQPKPKRGGTSSR